MIRLKVPSLMLTAGLVAGLGLVFLGTAVEVSSRPRFCGSCHVMTPYYESWKTSSHHNVACVECHIPPGVTAEVRKKWEALSMVASYFTGTYGTNPWAEIDDAACLRCHERRLLSGRELFGDVLFDHTKHLSGMRRGKTLRCTSCHSQIVQGSHIAVTASTCILCHFKDQPSNTGTARCTLCHHVPDKVIRHETLTFNHADVGRLGMDCTWCHARPAGSDGAVPRERCLTCHNDAERLDRYAETDLLHHTHVSEHKVDCLNCHLELEHVGPPRLQSAASSCGSCHLKGHSPQMSLYSGLGGRGVDPMPSAMFLAGVRCEGCHLQIPGQEAETLRASEISCMSCHGPGYRRIFHSWTDDMRQRAFGLEKQMAATQSAGLSPADQRLDDARFNLDLVLRGRGVHNVPYARALLKRSHELMNQARAARGQPPLAVPWKEAPYDSPCLRCHGGIAAQTGSLFGRSFSHEEHVSAQKLECAACHRTHEERDALGRAGADEVVKFDAGGCESCHHQETKADCLSCHAGVREKVVASERGPFDHRMHIDEAGQSCADCHLTPAGRPAALKKEQCASCHG